MKNRRRWLLIASVPLAIGVVLGVLAMLPARITPLRTSFEAIEEGMTPERVIAIFGQAPNYGGMKWHEYETMSWADEEDFAIISFKTDIAGNTSVVGKSISPLAGTYLQKFRRWLHLD